MQITETRGRYEVGEEAREREKNGRKKVILNFNVILAITINETSNEEDNRHSRCERESEEEKEVVGKKEMNPIHTLCREEGKLNKSNFRNSLKTFFLSLSFFSN